MKASGAFPHASRARARTDPSPDFLGVCRRVEGWRWMSPRWPAKVTTTREGVAPIFSASVSHLGGALGVISLRIARVRARVLVSSLIFPISAKPYT